MTKHDPQPPEGVEDSTPVSRFLTYRLARIQSQLNIQASRILKENAGLSLTQWRILALLGDAGGEARSNVLTRDPAMDKGLFSRKLKTLIEAGLVETRPDPADNRVQILKFSETGRDLHARTLPVMKSRQRMLRSVLSEDELAVFHSCLDRLEEASQITDFAP